MSLELARKIHHLYLRKYF